MCIIYNYVPSFTPGQKTEERNQVYLTESGSVNLYRDKAFKVLSLPSINQYFGDIKAKLVSLHSAITVPRCGNTYRIDSFTCSRQSGESQIVISKRMSAHTCIMKNTLEKGFEDTPRIMF